MHDIFETWKDANVFFSSEMKASLGEGIFSIGFKACKNADIYFFPRRLHQEFFLFFFLRRKTSSCEEIAGVCFKASPGFSP